MIAKSLLERGTQTNRQGLTNRMINADGDGDCVLIVCDDQMLDFSSAGECDVLNDSEISRHVL